MNKFHCYSYVIRATLLFTVSNGNEVTNTSFLSLCYGRDGYIVTGSEASNIQVKKLTSDNL
jgi:hypothetical protein